MNVRYLIKMYAGNGIYYLSPQIMDSKEPPAKQEYVWGLEPWTYSLEHANQIINENPKLKIYFDAKIDKYD